MTGIWCVIGGTPELESEASAPEELGYTEGPRRASNKMRKCGDKITHWFFNSLC